MGEWALAIVVLVLVVVALEAWCGLGTRRPGR